MKCPNCTLSIPDSAKSHSCGWRAVGSARSEADRNRAAFDSLAPCYKCGGTGITVSGRMHEVQQAEWMRRAGRKQITNGERRGFTHCICPRGKWMRDHATLFAAHNDAGGGHEIQTANQIPH